MILYTLLARARSFPVFQLVDCQKWFPATSRGTVRLQLAQYVRRGYLRRLRRGLYLLNDGPRPHPWVIASRLKPGAIISLEAVLGEAGIIPETPLAVTALTEKRGGSYVLPQLGTFIFRHLDPAYLFGWSLADYPPYSVRVAYPEKALLDLLWFHRREKEPASYLEGLRLSFPKTFSWLRWRSLARQFQDPRLQEMARLVERQFHHH